ncbi:MAG: hypothetical protein ACTSYD_04375 [Candidatus Heimdallarchaeaceae archaeon]
MLLSTLGGTLSNSAGHEITITKPENNSAITNAYKTSMNSEETKYVELDYTIENYDGYYCFYKVYLDGQEQNDLIDTSFDENTEVLVKSYFIDAQKFLNNHGQGIHTFTIKAYHRVLASDLTPGLTPGPGSDGYGYITDTVSATFTFNPKVLHFVAFWLTDASGVEWKDSILPFYDLLRSSRAHYLLGYHYMTGSWDDDEPGTVFKNNLAPAEDSNDIDIIMFYSHGISSIILGGNYIVCPKGFLADGCLTPKELKNDLQAAELDSSTVILIIDCCHSGMFIDTFKDTNIAVLTSSEKSEGSFYPGDDHYDNSWTMEKKIYEMNALFLHSLVQALYYESTLYVAFYNIKDSSFYDDPDQPGIQLYDFEYPRNDLPDGNKIYYDKQHPDSMNLELILNKELIFYDSPVL